jgi:dymeclin
MCPSLPTATIFKFPLSFYHYFVSSDGLSYPLADRSVLVLLVLLQSCRDSGSPTNPFREVLCSLTTTEKTTTSDAHDVVRVVDPKQDRGGKLLEISFSKLFASAGHKAPYESSHLLLYTLLYTNPMMHDAAIAQCDVDHVMLPLLETLYHAKSVDPSRIYMLVIVILTYTQDPAFVRDAHTKIMVHNVPWYSERYILDVSLGSLMMVIFTRLIYRNITHFQDSFIHLNAFAALSNLARAAENLHGYAAQNIVGLIEMLAKMENKFSARMARENQLENDELVQKRSAYVEFIRLLLGVVSSCLKPALLPRNPQLIYSLLYRAETFTALQQHPEISHQVNNYSIWATLVRFQTIVEAKTKSDETLDVDTVLELITAECVGLLASSAAASSSAARHGRGTPPAALAADDEASYRYEEETDPEQFFVPYIWKLIFEQTPEFCWKADKITLFTPGTAKASVTVTP